MREDHRGGSPAMLLYPSGNRDEEVSIGLNLFWQIDDLIGISRLDTVRITALELASKMELVSIRGTFNESNL